jgi:hypothetical protein
LLQNPLNTTNTAGRWVAVLVLMFVTAASNMTYAQTGGQEPSPIEAIETTYPKLAVMGYTEVSSAANIHSAGMVVTNAIPQEQQAVD